MTIYEAYVIKNLVNGKQYIGITSWGYKRRYARHKYEARRGNPRPLYAAMRKYGFDAFSVVVVETVSSWECLCERECYYIEHLNTLVENGRGYNLTLGGEGTPGRFLSLDHKAKILLSRTLWSDEKRENIRVRQRAATKRYWDTSADVLTRRQNISSGRKNYLALRPMTVSDGVNEKIRKTLQKNPSKRKTCIIDGVEYFSISEASRTLGIPNDTIRNRLKSKNYPTYIEGTLYGQTGKTGPNMEK